MEFPKPNPHIPPVPTTPPTGASTINVDNDATAVNAAMTDANKAIKANEAVEKTAEELKEKLKSENTRLSHGAQKSAQPICLTCYHNIATMMCSDCKKVYNCEECAKYYIGCPECRSDCGLVSIRVQH